MNESVPTYKINKLTKTDIEGDGLGFKVLSSPKTHGVATVSGSGTRGAYFVCWLVMNTLLT